MKTFSNIDESHCIYLYTNHAPASPTHYWQGPSQCALCNAAPRSAAPRSAAPRSAAPRSAAPRSAAPRSAAPRSAAPRKVPAIFHSKLTTESKKNL
jgi:hypothetical protein